MIQRTAGNPAARSAAVFRYVRKPQEGCINPPDRARVNPPLTEWGGAKSAPLSNIRDNSKTNGAIDVKLAIASSTSIIHHLLKS